MLAFGLNEYETLRSRLMGRKERSFLGASIFREFPICKHVYVSRAKLEAKKTTFLLLTQKTDIA